MSRLLSPTAAVLLVAAVAAGCTSIGLSTPSGSVVPEQSVCGGVSSDMGGCTFDRHVFTSSTCRDLAVEWARVFDRAVVAVLDGPPDAENGQSVLLRRALVIVTVDLNTRLRELDLRPGCDMPGFLAAAEPEFSARLREGVGAALFDGNPVMTYQDGLDHVKKVLRSIEDHG